MSTDDRTETEWAVRYPDGHVEKSVYEVKAGGDARVANARIAEAHGTGEAVVVSRTKTTSYSEWEAV